MSETAQQFFISYAGVDRPWAEWVGWQLEQGGDRVILDVWDWRTGDDFVRRMDEALEWADAVVALFSKAYFEDERWTGEEWSNAVARRDRVIPLAVEQLGDTDVRPMLASRIRTDLHGLDEQAAMTALDTAVHGGRRPTKAPPLPGSDAQIEDKPRLPSRTEEPELWGVRRRRNLDFSGREAQIAGLRDALPGDQHAVVALHGMGGIGKSQIALEYAYRFRSQYDLVWWIDAEQVDQIPVHYTELADRLGIAVKGAGAEHNARTLLAELRGRRRWLIILDNVESPEQIERWLPEGPGHVLITSRNPNWRRLARPTGLDVFARADSVAYFRTRVPSITGDEADTLADELGDLPLALVQAADMIERGTHVDLYRRLLRENTSRILREGEVPDYPAPLAAAIGIAAEDLDDEYPDAAALLRLAAFLGPDPIPTDWLVNARARLSTIPVHADELTWMQSTLEPLRRYSLVRVDGRTFQVHRLTQAVLRHQVAPARTDAIHEDVAAVLASVPLGDPETPADWPAWASLTSHLVSRHIDVTHRPELRPALCNATHFLIRSGQPQAAVELATTLRDAWTEQLGPDHPDVLTCLQYLGHATSDLGDFRRARPIIQEALTRRRNVLGEDHPDTLRSANDHAVGLASLGDYAEARNLCEDTLVRRWRVLGEDHPDTLQSAANMTRFLSDEGDLVRARELEESTLAHRRRVLGVDHPDTLRSTLQLAEYLREVGEESEAHRLHEETWRRCRATLGDDHRLTHNAARLLASTLSTLGRVDEARTLIEDVLARRRRVYEEDHPETAHAAYALAIVLNRANEYEEARRLLMDVIASESRVLGQDHPEALKSGFQLAITLQNLGQFEEARRVLGDVLVRRRRVLGEEHRETLRAAHQLAVILCKMRSFSDAVTILEDVRARQRRSLGDDHRDTAMTTQSLAEAYERSGRKHEAHKLTAKRSTKRKFRRKSR